MITAQSSAPALKRMVVGHSSKHCRRALNVCASAVCTRLRVDDDAVVPLRRRKAAKPWDALYSKKRGSYFVDFRRTRIKAGNGGDGAISTSSIFRVEFAGPDGGDGGNGAHVVFQASKEVSSLAHVRTLVSAPDGGRGGGDNCSGKSANHLFVNVPVGTIFRNLNRDIVAELTQPGSLFLAAKGGAGGRGNASFRTSVNKTPMLAEEGGIGETFIYDIEMRSMAHVGLVGFPNAGKSTLLRAISRARPKIASYPFTTLNPHIGMVSYDDHVQLAVADIPGIIKDAHRDKGLGISFLRHIERCDCLLYVIDLSQCDPEEQFEILKYELEQYSPGLSSRPHAIIANKMDMESARMNSESFEDHVKTNCLEVPIFYVSGKMSLNLRCMLDYIRKIYDKTHKDDLEEDE